MATAFSTISATSLKPHAGVRGENPDEAYDGARAVPEAASASSPKNDRSRFLNGTRCGVPAIGGTFSQTEGTKTMNEKVQRIMGPVMDRRAASVTVLQFGLAMLAAGLVLGVAITTWVMP